MSKSLEYLFYVAIVLVAFFALAFMWLNTSIIAHAAAFIFFVSVYVFHAFTDSLSHRTKPYAVYIGGAGIFFLIAALVTVPFESKDVQVVSVLSLVLTGAGLLISLIRAHLFIDNQTMLTRVPNWTVFSRSSDDGATLDHPEVIGKNLSFAKAAKLVTSTPYSYGSSRIETSYGNVIEIEVNDSLRLQPIRFNDTTYSWLSLRDLLGKQGLIS